MLVKRITEWNRFGPRMKEMQQSCMSNGLLSLVLEPKAQITLFCTYMKVGRGKTEKQNKTKCRQKLLYFGPNY